MSRSILFAILLALAVPASAQAATDAQAAGGGFGIVSLTDSGTTTTCNAPVAVTISVRANTATLTETWASASGTIGCAASLPAFQTIATTAAPGYKQCISSPVLMTLASFPYTVTQVGSTYTLKSSGTLCGGTALTDSITVTIRPTQIVLAHTLTESGVVVYRSSATVARAV